MAAPGSRFFQGTQPWRIACGFCAMVSLTVIAAYYLPARREVARLRREQDSLRADREASVSAHGELRAQLARYEAQQRELRAQLDAPKAAAARVRSRIDTLEQSLSARFRRLTRAKMMAISSAGDHVSIALAVPALFSSRERLTANGRSLLCELARAIMAEYRGQIRVTGYHGKQRLSETRFAARYGTPWHLAAARAASAAHALGSACELPVERLFVVSYGPRAAGPLGENVALEFVFRPEDEVQAD